MDLTRKIFSVAGIPVKIHLSLGLLLLWLLMQQDQRSGFEIGLSFLMLLGSVTMHELAHALTAKHFGIRTRDITLYPFGGIAMLLDKISAKQELFITLAGPLSNLLLAALILLNTQLNPYSPEQFLSSPLGELLAINMALGIFNLIPAFPMDGGRILRSALMLLKIKQANVIASRTSQAICVLLGAAALYYSNPILFLIAVFIFGNASKELMLTRATAPVKDIKVSEVMIHLDKLISLTPSVTIEDAAKFALKTAQTHFPVMLAGQFLGLVEREDLLHRAMSNAENEYVTGIMLKNIPTCSQDQSLNEVLQMFELHFTSIMLVTENDLPEADNSAAIGLIFKDQLESLMFVQQILSENNKHRELEKTIEL